MIEKTKLDELLSKFYNEMRSIFKDKLIQVILFGSYTTGNQDEESDIDVMILVDVDKIKAKEYMESVINVVCELDLEYDVVLSPIIQSCEEFNEYKDVLPFFKNVQKGVRISA